jgi:hypothetical protein
MSHLSRLLLCLVLAAPLALTACSATGELTSAVPSPDGAHEARLYYLNPGAAASSASRVDVVDLDSGKSRELWFGPPEVESVTWIDNRTISVGEQILDIGGAPFDWYDDRPSDGHASPEAAARSFVKAVVARDLKAAQNASAPILTEQQFEDLRKRLLSTSATATVTSIELEVDPSITASDQREYLVIASMDGEAKSHKWQSLVQLESGKWRVEWLEPEGTF